MRRGLVVLLALAMLPMPAPAQEGGSQAQDWPPWFDESLTVRVPVEIQADQPGYPDDWDGPRLVAHELDVTQTLIDAGWPLDTATGLPQRFTLDVDSIRVVPTGSDEAVYHMAWDGAILSERGTHPAGHRIVTVAWMADEDASGYHIYLDRTEDDEHDPLPRDPVAEQRMLQLLAGPGAGHELYGIVQGTVTLMLASGHTTQVTAERLTSQGWSAISGCNGQTLQPSPTSWVTCTENFRDEPVPIRVKAQRPVAAYTWAGAQNEENARFLPLAGATGPNEASTLLAPASYAGQTPIDLMALAPCDGGDCQATVGGQTVTVAVDQATRVEITQPTLIQANGPIIGWIPGRGPSPMPLAVGENVTSAAMSLPEAGSNILLASGDRNARVQAFTDDNQVLPVKRLIDGTTARPEHDQGAALWRNLPGTPSTGIKMQSEREVFWPSAWNSQDGATQLAPTASGAVGMFGPADEGTIRVAGIAFGGRTSIGAAIEGERVPVSGIVSEERAFGEGDDDAPTDGGLAEAWVEGDPSLFAAYALVGDGDIAPGPLASHLEPMGVSTGQPQAIGPLFDLDIEPESKIAAPGEVLVFDVEGRGLVRSADGSTQDLEISMNVDATTSIETAPDLDVEIEQTRATLPQGDPEPITRVTVTVPTAIEPGLKPVYALTVSGTPVDGGDTIEATASIQVIPQREISLSFEDGSSVADLETEDDGTVRAGLVLENQGTDREPVALDVTVPDAEGWTVQLLDARTREPIEQTELSPGEQRDLILDVTAETEGPLILNAKITAQSLLDASVADDATARIAHGVSTDTRFAIRPDLVSLHRGGQATVNLTMDNRGSPVNVRVQPEDLDNLVVEAQDTSVNLGEPGSGSSNASVPINLTVGNQAPLGGVLVATIELEMSVGSLEPVTELMTVRVRILPQHALEPVNALTLLPGVRQATTLDVRAAGDTDEQVSLSLREAPAGWRVELPENLTVPRNTTGPIRMNITTPAGAEPGSVDLRFLAEPTDGSDPIMITARAGIEQSPAYNLTAPATREIGIGETQTFNLNVENRGNTRGDLEIDASSELVDVTLRPASLSLGAGETREVSVEVTGAQVGDGALTFSADPGGQATTALEVGTVELAVELVSMDPTPPEEGEPLRVVASVSNSGTVSARDVDLVLTREGQTVVSERIGRLEPGSEVTISLRTNSLPSIEDLRLVVDPDDRYTQDTSDDEVSLAQQDAPMIPILATLLSIATVAFIRRRV